MDRQTKRKPVAFKRGFDPETEDTITQYMNEIARTPLLTAEEELELGKAMVAGRAARKRLYNRVTSSAERKRLTQVVQEGDAARQRLISANFRLVISIAKKYRERGVLFSDLIQEGNIGLMRAVDKFDYTRGFKFSTYATWWIRQSVTRAIADHGRMIRLPVHASDKVNRLAIVSRQLEQELGRKPTADEIARELNISAYKVERLIERSQQPLSLEMTLGQDTESTLGDIIPDEQALSPSESATRQLLSEEIRGALAGLTAREQEILSLRFGLADGQARTLDDIGEQLGYTRERIRQIETQALRKLRDPRLTKRLSGYLES